MSIHDAGRTRLSVLDLALRATTAAGLAVDAFIHLQLSSMYQLAAPGGIGQGNLFRIAAVAAVLAALYVLLRGSQAAYGAAFLAAASALGAVVLYRYVNVPALGPLPSMYEPLWFAKKSATALAEALASVAAMAGLARGWRRAPPGQA
ncbi:MAG: hypothetical protein ABIP57_01140 [Jatrophihabitantaceae bacterium]